MALYIQPHVDLKNYSKTQVFIKSEETPYIMVDGKIISAESDTDMLKIQTETTTAIFDIKEVIAVNFLK